MKQINYKSIQLDGIRYSDYPDFVDAYIAYAEYDDGTELEEAALDKLNNDGQLILDKVYEDLF